MEIETAEIEFHGRGTCAGLFKYATRSRTSVSFKASDKAKGAQIKQVFGYSDIAWPDEPKRLRPEKVAEIEKKLKP